MGRVKTIYAKRKDGSIIEIYSLIRKKKNGMYRTFHKNGNLNRLCFFKDDVIVGSYKVFNDKNKLIYEKEYPK